MSVFGTYRNLPHKVRGLLIPLRPINFQFSTSTAFLLGQVTTSFKLAIRTHQKRSEQLQSIFRPSLRSNMEQHSLKLALFLLEDYSPQAQPVTRCVTRQTNYSVLILH